MSSQRATGDVDHEPSDRGRSLESGDPPAPRHAVRAALAVRTEKKLSIGASTRGGMGCREGAVRPSPRGSTHAGAANGRHAARAPGTHLLAMSRIYASLGGGESGWTEARGVISQQPGSTRPRLVVAGVRAARRSSGAALRMVCHAYAPPLQSREWITSASEGRRDRSRRRADGVLGAHLWQPAGALTWGLKQQQRVRHMSSVRQPQACPRQR